MVFCFLLFYLHVCEDYSYEYLVCTTFYVLSVSVIRFCLHRIQFWVN